jgi:hypothetical protein
MTKKANEVPDNALMIEEGDEELQTSEELTEEEQDDLMLARIRERYETMYTFWQRIHKDGRKDDKFIAGDHWPEQIKQDREEEGRPVLTYNLLPAFVRQITNRIRQERPRPRVVPVETSKEGKLPVFTNMAGNKDYSVADVMTGLLRQIEHESRADQCYDTATKHAADHGFGFFYLIPEEDPRDPFVQSLRYYRVKDSYTVLLDPSAQEADYRDSQDGIIYTRVSRSAFKHKYPDTEAVSFDYEHANIGDWYTADDILVVQYFYIDYQDDHVVKMSNGMTHYLSDVEDILDDIKRETGVHIIKRPDGTEMKKAVKRPVCMWLKCTAHDILDRAELPFSAIPIFPVFGEELVIEGEARYESAIRHALDAQMSYNYWRTAAAESVALAPKAPWVLTSAQIKGHERLWNKANKSNVPFLTYNHKDGVAQPQRQFPGSMPAAELQNAMQDGSDMQAIIGLHDASLGREGNEKSGKAIIARQSQGNTSTFQFPDNLTRAINQCTRLAVEAIPRLYDTQRVVRIRNNDDTEDFIELNKTFIDEKTQKEHVVHDLGVVMYDVVMETGTSYATQRQEAADLQMEMLKILGPDKASNIIHLIVRNLGVPGSEEVYEILRKMLPDALKTPEEREADLPPGITLDDNGQPVDAEGNPWTPPPTVEQQIAMKQQEVDQAKADAEKATAEAKMATAEADKIQAQAKIEDAKVKQAKAAAEMESLRVGQEGDQQTPSVDMGEIEQIIKRAFEEHNANPNAHKQVTEDMIANAIVEALTRVKAYVDNQVDQVGAGIDEDLELVGVDENGQEVTRTKANGKAAGKSSAGTGSNTPKIEVNLGKPAPSRVDHKYDAAGNLVSSTPIYEES